MAWRQNIYMQQASGRPDADVPNWDVCLRSKRSEFFGISFYTPHFGTTSPSQMSTTLHPQVCWSQRKGNICLTVDVQDVEDLKIDLQEQSLKFHAKSEQNIYEFDLQFLEKIDKEKSKWIVTRNVHFLLEKQEAQRWSKLTSGPKPHWLKIDWNQWLDTDEEEEQMTKGLGGNNDFDFSNMMSGLGGQGGFPGMDGLGGMGGMDGMDGLDDEATSDDDELNGLDEPVDVDGIQDTIKETDVTQKTNKETAGISEETTQEA